MNEYQAYIPLLASAKRVVKIDKGFSFDQKFVLDNRYLLRIFADENDARRRTEFETIQKLHVYSKYVPEAIEYGNIYEKKEAFMILTYLPGEDAEVSLKKLTNEEQYHAGYTAGEELKKLHKYPAPKNIPTWYEHKRQKTEKYLEQFESLEVDENVRAMLTSYIQDNMGQMQGQPNMFQHDDFHPSNLLINDRKFGGIIDFQRMDWGDPIHDLHKLGFFSSRISVPFTRGIIDGYHSKTGIGNFWELYSLYSAMHIVSALVWGKQMGNFDKMLAYSLDVIHDHNRFNKTIPRWYEVIG
ncbi:aminoglycoside phosphotransferase family protein [Ornithinibacillus scapharcae]|uniref:aminoglycoside phosphotransferase family protein n=1 Tax=Ornithinibacillus scapharcae TaxID=1147159 RepID=UPI000225BA04|nr:aminoglycoside phosphotransferase family protein [Ornithinibacillus scapharcae]